MLFLMENNKLIEIDRPTYQEYPRIDLSLKMRAKVYSQEGDLGYVYSPFKNIQISKDYEDSNGIQFKQGQLINFKTNKLGFNLKNPIDIQVQPSYDGTVNLILNDDLNPPRIINSRFTTVEDKRFKIIDRKGDTDTNIYSDENVDLETRLFKNYNKVPYVQFLGLQEGGNLLTGNYSFYFKYTDVDGNESDIIAETGVICVHEGGINNPSSISGGILNTNCNKIIKIKINNLDTSYNYVNIYYTRSTGEDSYNPITEYIKLTDSVLLDSDSLEITITGFENKQVIDQNLLNVEYNMVSRVKSQAQIQNMLFFANVDKPTIPYKDLEDLSLRILPGISNDNNIGCLNDDYSPSDGNSENIEYYNMKNVYNYTGYWNNEIYRVGVVYILKDDSLSPVFNIRGCDNLTESTNFLNIPMYSDADKTKRNYIPLNESGFYQNGNQILENIRGVIRIKSSLEVFKKDPNQINPIGLDFKISNDVLEELKKFVKGLFFVRQKRIPTILAQGLSVGVDSESYLPCLKDESGFFTESFLDSNRKLSHDFEKRKINADPDKTKVRAHGLISPELTLNKVVSSGMFNNSEFILTNSFIDNDQSIVSNKHTDDVRHFGIKNYVNKDPFYSSCKTKLVSIMDGGPLKFINGLYFSSLAGMAEEAIKFKYFGYKNRQTNARNLVRGLFTPFLGSSAELPTHKIFNIHTPGYRTDQMEEYFKIRFGSFYSYYPIGNRYDLNLIESKYLNNIKDLEDGIKITEYRGDCFINTVTVRINRNFIDPETPLNDDIVKYDTWSKNYLGPDDMDDSKDNSKLNRSDVNAVKLGHWVTFKVFSNINMALRSLDNSDYGEQALLGQPRGFYPVQELSAGAESKMAESEIYNAGYKNTTSKKEHVILPDVPYIKNIFDNRIMFSSKHVNDAFQNGYRVFQGLSYQDVTRQYGSITKILNWKDNLLTVFENGIALLGINDRALLQSETGQSVHMYGAGVLPDKETPISVDFGSRWAESIIKTPIGLYGVDSESKKIWRFSDNKGFEIISDFKIQRFLNDNLIMYSDETNPIIGLRNIKTHYDNFKGDVIFTFYNCTRDENREWNLIYNERMDKWITKTDWTPLASGNINSLFISFDKERAKEISLNAYTLEKTDYSEGIVLNTNIIQSGKIGDLSIKGYDHYSKYNVSYEVDHEDFKIIINEGKHELHYNTTPSKSELSKIIKITAKFTDGEYTLPPFIDFLYLTSNQDVYVDNFLYKHGQASLFQPEESGEILPTRWYDRQHSFEFEFIVNNEFHLQKIFDNLKIISNKVKPEQLTMFVVGDSYTFKTKDMDGITTTQNVIDIATHGRVFGNAHYKQDIWDIQIAPINIDGVKPAKIRDKYAKIRLKYNGEDLAIITLIQILYTISYG